MTLQEFKSANNIVKLPLYKSKSSNRLVGNATIDGKKRTIVTAEEFDMNKPAYTVDVEVEDVDLDTGEATGRMNILTVITNKQPATPAMEL